MTEQSGAAPKPDLDFEDFFTTDIASQGKKFFIPAPTGGLSEHWMVLRHADSNEFRMARNTTIAARLAVSDEEPARLAQTEEDFRLTQLAALVVSWSFSAPCNSENIRKLFTKAPYLADFVDRKAMDRKAFFEKR